MQQVKVSPKFQVVVPKPVRELLGIRPGQSLQVVPYGDRIKLVPMREIGEMRSLLSGMNPQFEREPYRQLLRWLWDSPATVSIGVPYRSARSIKRTQTR